MGSKIDPLVVEYVKTRNPELKAEIVEKYQYLVEYIAKRLSFNKSDVDDLIQVGSIAILKALERFKTDKNTDFATFATPNIIGEIQHYFRDKSRVMKVPRKLQELYRKIKNSVSDAQDSGDNLKIPELAKKFDVSEEKILEALEAGYQVRVLSLDAPSHRNDFFKGSQAEPSLLDNLGSVDKEDNFLNKETLKQAILQLTTRQRRIVYLRFYGGLSQSEIANRLELSQMHISRLLSRAIKFLKQELHKEIERDNL